jgi:uncharacterized protein YlxW (UPF0749 family)
VWAVGLLAAALSFWIVQEVRVQNLLAETAAAREGIILSALLQQAYQSNATLAARVAALQGTVQRVQPPSSAEEAAWSRAQVLAGLTPVAGAGVVVTLADSPKPRYPGEPAAFQLVHDQYVLHIVGLLAGVGARAIAVSGQRFVSTTAVFCAGPTIRVNGVVEGSPFTVDAVGPVHAMLAALAHDPDVQGWAQLVEIHYRAVRRVRVPALQSVPPLDIATVLDGSHGKS